MRRTARQGLLLAVLFVALLLALDAYDAPRSLSAPAPAAEPHREPQGAPQRAPAPIVREEEPPDPVGRTRFQRRLAAGSALKRLQRDVEDDVRATAALLVRFRRLVPALLHADDFDPRDVHDGDRQGLWNALETLTVPARDVEGLQLSPQAEDALGTGLMVRIWTQEGTYPESEVAEAEAMLRHVASVAGMPHEDGFDVLATPDMGRDAFPGQAHVEWAAGLYLRADRYCAIRSHMRPGFRVEVLKHELVHALTARVSGPAFVHEGLAEYLRLCRPGDRGLDVPKERLADSLAALHAIHVRIFHAGGSLRATRPARFLAMSPAHFYALRHFGYLTAQAAMAYVGAEVLERALQLRSSRPIAEAVRRIRWADFLEFVERGAAGGEGARAVVVTDPEGKAADVRDAFSGLGVDLPEYVDPRCLEHRPVDRLRSREQQRALLEILGRPGARPILLTDISPAMDEPFVLAADHDLLARPFSFGALQAATRRAFVERLYHALRDGAGGEPPVLATLTDAVRVIEPAQLAEELPFHTDRAGSWLRGTGARDSFLVLCVASRDRIAREIAERHAASQRRAASRDDLVDVLAVLLARGTRLRGALVIDLARGECDAPAMAEAIALAQGFGGEIAYWDPQEER